MSKDLILAVETGGTKLQLVAGDKTGKIYFKKRVPVPLESGAQGTLDCIVNSVPEFLEKAAEIEGKIQRMGIGFGGAVNSKTQRVFASVQIPGWKDFPLSEYMEEKTGLPTRIYNDSNAAAWGEYVLGSGKNQAETFFYTNIGSGVGGGIVINGALYDGMGYGAGEFGQTYVADPWENKPFPGERVENLCSGWAIQERLRKMDIPQNSLLWQLCSRRQAEITSKMFGEAVLKEDEFAVNFLDTVAHTFSLGLANVIDLISPEIIAVGGGVSLIGEPLISRLNTYTAQYIHYNNRGKYKIVQSELGEMTVPVGTLLLTGQSE